jgi:hypothetical protein
VEDAADQTWTLTAPVKLEHVVVYGERRVRDWRWLWLRRRSDYKIVGAYRVDG